MCMVPITNTFLDIWMKITGHTQKKKKQDCNSILGYCILKMFFVFNYPWEKKVLNEVSW